jgi:hypothetical protein
LSPSRCRALRVHRHVALAEVIIERDAFGETRDGVFEPPFADRALALGVERDEVVHQTRRRVHRAIGHEAIVA